MTTGSMGEILNLLLGGGSSLPPGIPQGATRVSDTLYIVTLSDGRTAYFVPENDLADEPTGRFVLDTSYAAPSGGGGGAAAPSVSSYMDIVTTTQGLFRVNKQTGGVEQIYEFGMSEEAKQSLALQRQELALEAMKAGFPQVSFSFGGQQYQQEPIAQQIAAGQTPTIQFRRRPEGSPQGTPWELLAPTVGGPTSVGTTPIPPLQLAGAATAGTAGVPGSSVYNPILPASAQPGLVLTPEELQAKYYSGPGAEMTLENRLRLAAAFALVPPGHMPWENLRSPGYTPEAMAAERRRLNLGLPSGGGGWGTGSAYTGMS